MRIRNRDTFFDRRRLRIISGVVALGLAGAAVAQQQGPTPPASGSAVPGANAATQTGEPAWLLIPIELSTRSQEFTQGCWIRLYSGDNFGGRMMTVVGPANLAEVRSPYGTGLNNWESAEVGPNATVTTYDDENFRARSATLRPGQRYAELDDSKLGLFEDIESMRVTCAPSANATAGTSGASPTTTAPGTERKPDAAAASSGEVKAAAGSASTQDDAQRGAASSSAPTSQAGGSAADETSVTRPREAASSPDTTPSSAPDAEREPGTTTAPPMSEANR